MNVVTLRLVTLYIDLLDVGKSAHFMNIKTVKSVAGLEYSGNTFRLMNVVTLRWARLVPRWVTVVGRVNHLGVEPGTQAYSACACPLCRLE